MKEVRGAPPRSPACPAKTTSAPPISTCARGSTRSSTRPKQQGSLQVALSGLNSIRQTLDSLSRLAGFDRQGTQVNVAVQTNVHVDLRAVAERVIKKFDHEPEIKARIAQALLEVDHEPAA